MKNLKLLSASIGIALISALSLTTCVSKSSKSPQGLNEFLSWIDKAKTVFNSYPSFEQNQSHSVLGEVICGYSEIGDRWMTEPACSSVKKLKIGSKNLEFKADWSIKDPQVWHADVNLEMIGEPDCSFFNSAIQVERKENEQVIFCLCQLPNHDQIVMVKTKSNNNTIIAYIPTSFIKRYPKYIPAVSSGIDK